jgi:hypothetical protein
MRKGRLKTCPLRVFSEQEKRTLTGIATMLNNLGLSGLAKDVRKVREAKDPSEVRGW